MRLSIEGIERLKQFEGFSAKAYQCSAGVWTIGYGSTKGVHEHLTITKAEAEQLLVKEITGFEKAVNDLVKVPLSQSQFDALVCFTYNVGITAFKKSTLLKLLNKGDYEAVPAQLMRWNKAGGRVVRGLTTRRAAEAGMWAKGEFVASREEVPEPEKPLTKSRAIAGGTIAGGATIASEIVKETQEQVEAAIPYADIMQYVFLALVLTGIGITIYARWDDHRKAVR